MGNTFIEIFQIILRTFLKDLYVAWSPAHRIKLSIKDVTLNYKEKTIFDTIQSTMKLFSYGKPFMESGPISEFKESVRHVRKNEFYVCKTS